MTYTRNEVVEKLIKYYSAYYNIERYDDNTQDIIARCDFFEHSQKYVLVEKAELWSSDGEEFVYFISIPHFTKEVFEKYRDLILADGKSRMHIAPGHMYSFITPIFITEKADSDAIKMLQKFRYYKSFHFSLHGWMDYRTALLVLEYDKLFSNGSGRSVLKIMKKVLYSKLSLRKEKHK